MKISKVKDMKIYYEDDSIIIYSLPSIKKTSKANYSRTNYYKSRKYGVKLCKTKMLHKKDLERELSKYLNNLDNNFNKFETEQFHKLEQIGAN